LETSGQESVKMRLND